MGPWFLFRYTAFPAFITACPKGSLCIPMPWNLDSSDFTRIEIFKDPDLTILEIIDPYVQMMSAEQE